MQNIDSLSWLKTRCKYIIDMCTDWAAGYLSNTQIIKSLGGEAYNTILTDSKVIPALDLYAYNSVTNSDGVPSGVSFTRSSTATAIDQVGNVYSVAANELRHDWNPTTGEYLGWLIEGTATNILLYSQDFTQSGSWASNGLTVAANATTSPDGTTNACSVTVSDATNPYLAQNVSLTSGTQYTLSVWVKGSASSNGKTGVIQFFRNSDGLDVTSTSFTISSSSWTRVSVINTAGVLTTGTYTVRLDLPDVSPSVNDVVYIWGAQLESGSYVTSYIPTTTAQAVRADDMMYVPITNFPFNQNEGTVYAEVDFDGIGRPAGYGNFVSLAASSSPTTNRLCIYFNDSSVNDSCVFYICATTIQWNATALNNLQKDTKYRVAMAYKDANCAGVVNGSNLITKSTTVAFPTFAYLCIGNTTNGTASYQPHYGHVKHILYFTKRLSNNEILRLTK